MSEQLSDEFFAEYAKTLKQKEDDAKNSNGSSYSSNVSYEDLAYTGTDKGQYRIVRLLGAPIGTETVRPSFKRGPNDPRELIVADVKDDEGKRFTIRMPLPAERESDSYILLRLYNKVMEKTYINKKPVYVNEGKFPELFELVSKGGFKESDGFSFTYSKGFKGDRIVVYNVIDRSDDWCAKNKHTKILARDVTIDDQNRVWAKAGLKSFGFVSKIRDLIGKYGNYEKYDVAIKKNGEKDNPFDVKNASRLKEADMMEELINNDGSQVDKNYIVEGEMTPEERQYKAYDLEKLFAPTSYRKLLKRIPSLFKLCDACLGTHYFEELQGLADKERQEWDAKNTEKEAEQEAAENAAIRENLDMTDEQIDNAVSPENPGLSDDAVFGAPTESFDTMKDVEEAPKRRSASSETGLTADKIALLKGYDMLPENLKGRIKDVKNFNGKVSIVWDNEADCLACDKCEAMSPEVGTTHCPVCGVKFE
ncbi:MAG: hypothetical protein HUJ68_10035 [Clostridia bacterium]|nr:hypothetical protein [Clostridia bacterium]